MKRTLALLLTLCTLLCLALPVFATDTSQQAGEIPDAYKWDFWYDATTGVANESNGGKHCMIQRHSGYRYHEDNGCDCGNTDEVTHFDPFGLVAYSNGYNQNHSSDYIDKYVPMVQTDNIWNFGDAIDLAGNDWVSSNNIMEYLLCSSVDRGIVFTAPVSGEIKFDFYFKSTSTNKADLLIGKKANMTETCNNWSGDWNSSSCIKYVSGSTADGLDTVTIAVNAGEEIVFLLHSNMTDNVVANFFFDTVEYTYIGEVETPDEDDPPLDDNYAWDFGYDCATGAFSESNGGKHCLIQRHSGYRYHANNGCDCGNAEEVTHFAPFSLVAYSNGYHTGQPAGYNDTYVPMVQNGNCWNFTDAVDLIGTDSVTAADGMTYYLCSSVDRGIIFKAPVMGTVTFDFYFKSTSSVCPISLLIGKKSDMIEYCQNWAGDWNDETLLAKREAIDANGMDSITLNVNAGDEIVFLLHSNMKDGVNASFFFDEVEYISVGEHTAPDLDPIDTGFFTDKTPVTDYAYSFAVVGDTQIVTEYYPDELPKLYDWLVENAESKKMKYVLGLGDITNSNTQAEWTLAKQQISKLNGVVPYSVIRGNHDGPTEFNQYFANDTAYTSQLTGQYASGDVRNTYTAFAVGTHKYLLVTLDYGAADSVLEWAGEVIEQYPEHSVIITTHSYLEADGTRGDANGYHPPSKDDASLNNGADMWNELIRKHQNIKLVLCGHISTDNVIVTQTKGDHGNTVTQILIDFQGLDHKIGGTSMINMLYFSEDGNTVTVETYSAAKDAYFKQNNQFTIMLDAEASEDSGNSNGSGNHGGNDTTDSNNGNGGNKKPEETTETVETPTDTDAPAPKKKGCGSAVLGFPILFLTAGLAILSCRKKNDCREEV